MTYLSLTSYNSFWCSLVILIDNKSWANHLVHLGIKILKNHQLFIKKQKCSFSQSKVEYLGHIVSRVGVAADPSKLQAIVDWPIHTTVKGLRGFLTLWVLQEVYSWVWQDMLAILSTHKERRVSLVT